MKFEMAEIKVEKFEIMDVITTSGEQEECTVDLSVLCPTYFAG